MRVARLGTCKRWTGGLIGCLSIVVLSAGVASADPTPQTKQLFSFGPDGTEASDFGRVGALTVDQGTGNVYVYDSVNEVLLRFDSDGDAVDFSGSSAYIDGNGITEVEDAAQVAVNSDSHVFYAAEETAVRAFQENGEPAEFTEGPGAGSNEIPGFSELTGLAVDINGNIYAGDGSGTVSIYAATGAFLTSFSATSPRDIAVDAAGAVYVLQGGTDIMKFSPDGLPISAGTTYSQTTFITRNSMAAFIVAFGIQASTQETILVESNFGESWIRVYDSAGTFLESVGEPGTSSESESLEGGVEGIAVLANGNEIQPKEVIEFYVGNSVPSNESAKVTVFGTRIIVDSPAVSGLRVTDLSGDSAVLRASVNPNTQATTYWFEYGVSDCPSSACISVPLGGDEIGEGFEPVSVSQLITGLIPLTTYHYRIIAENELGVGEEESMFTTQPLGGGFELSDNRAWEMVSPPNKRAATLVGPAPGLIQAAASGDKIIYLSRGSIEADPDGNRSLEVSSVLGKRGAEGWVSKDITPANSRAVALSVGQQGEYKIFNSDLSESLLEPHDGTQLSPAASERTPYLREEAEPPKFIPLVTGKEGFANVPPETVFGGDPRAPIGSVAIAGTNAGLEDVVLTSQVPLMVNAPVPALYHWSKGALAAVSVLPASEGGEFVDADILGSGPGSVKNAISEDGSRIFWALGNFGTTTALFVRDMQAEATGRLDVVQPGASGLGQARAVFQGANSEGTVVIFKDSQQLTEDASSTGSDLYQCEIPAGDSSAGCAELTNLTATGGGESAEVVGLVSGISDDASSIYFVARGVLDSLVNGDGDVAETGQPNLYHWQEGGGIRYVATLSENDDPNWGGDIGGTFEKSATASPNGRYLAFMSERSLTGQNNLDAESGKPVQQAYVYDSEEEELTCVSCNPFGAAPRGEVSAGFSQMVDPNRQWEGQLVAAILPQPTTARNADNSLYQPRSLLDSGRLFFNSLDGIVPADVNNQWDVYQFESVGAGSCSLTSAGPSVVRSGNGCVSLLSSGTASDESVFLDASVSGDDAFLLTPARLSVLDRDSELDVYDARVNGVPAGFSPSSECSGQGCRPNATPPSEGNPASAAFEGSGNLKGGRKCPKGKKKVRRGGKTKCVPKKKKHRGAPGRTGHKRRGS